MKQLFSLMVFFISDKIGDINSKLSKEQYLAFNRSMMDTVRFESEALPQRGAPL